MAILIQDQEPFYAPNIPVNARPTLDPFSELIDNIWVLDSLRFREASSGENRTWSLSLPWPSESDPDTTQWVIVQSDGEIVTGLVPEGIAGPVDISTLVNTYHWTVGVPGFVPPINEGISTHPAFSNTTNYPTNDIYYRGPEGPNPPYGVLAARPHADLVGDRTLYVATDQNGGTIYEVQNLSNVLTWVQIGIGSLDSRLTNSRAPLGHALSHRATGSDPLLGLTAPQITSVSAASLLGQVASSNLALVPSDIPSLDTGKITSGTLALARLSGITHSQLDALAGILGTQIHDVPANLVTGLLSPLQGGTGLNASGAGNGQLLIGTGSGLSLAALTAGTGITITNTSGHIQIDGATTYTLPIASASVLGGIKVGSNLSIDGTGVLSGAAPYTLPTASASVLGGIKVGSNLAIDGSGVLSGTYSYTLPIASASVLGGVKQGSNVTIDSSGVISVAAPYSLSIASASVLGGVKQGSNVTIDGSGVLSVAAPTGGTVTSVALTTPSELSVGGSPVTGSGTLALTWASQNANLIFAGPTSGTATPGFRSLVPTDIPSLDVAKITTGTFATSFIPNLDTSKITTGTLDLARLSGITTSQLSATAGITSGQITSIPNQNASIITAGTLALARGGTAADNSSVAINLVWAGPSSGTTGSAQYRALVAADIPALAYVTSVAMTVPADMAISGSPITSSGTLALTRSNQTGNVVMASPSGGGSGTPGFRTLVAADVTAVNPSSLTGTGTIPQAANTPAVASSSTMAAWARYA